MCTTANKPQSGSDASDASNLELQIGDLIIEKDQVIDVSSQDIQCNETVEKSDDCSVIESEDDIEEEHQIEYMVIENVEYCTYLKVINLILSIKNSAILF